MGSDGTEVPLIVLEQVLIKEVDVGVTVAKEEAERREVEEEKDEAARGVI